jgi:NAD-dependent SIR2 family protein deacetylase
MVQGDSLRGRIMESYCMKCRAKREMKNPKTVKLKNGRPASQGVCAKCGSKLFRIGKAGPPPGPDFDIPKQSKD